MKRCSLTYLLLPAVGALLLARPTRAQIPSFGQLAGISQLISSKSSRRTVAHYQYQGREYPVQRTPTRQLPQRYGDLITALEEQLDRCRTTMLTDSLAIIYTPEQQLALRDALNNLLRAHLHWDTAGYRAEIAFYQAEDTRRRQAAAPVK